MRLRPPPSRPVTQNAQSTAHPVWEERQTVKWPTGGVEGRRPRVEGCGAGDGAGVGELVDARRGLVDRHVHGFDEGPVGQAQAELHAAVHGLLAPRDLGKANRQLARERLPQVSGQLAHRGVVEARAAVKRVEDLAPPVPRKLPFLGERFPRGGGQAERIHIRGRVYSRRGAGRGSRRATWRLCGRRACADADLARRIDAQRLEEAEILEVDAERRALARSLDLFGLGGGRHGGPARPAAALALVHADLRVENHVEVVAFVADALDGVVHPARARDRLVDRLAQLLEHFAEVIGEFHVRGDYRFLFRRESRIFAGTKSAILCVVERPRSA